MSLRPNGMHHIALMTTDIKQQIAFFSEVLGARLVAFYWMHGVEGAWHAFMELSASSTVAFVQTPAVKDIACTPGVTHAQTPGHPCAAGTMQHLALNVDRPQDLLAMRDRIRAHGVVCFGPVDHGMCSSIYFAGPEGLNLEISTSASAIDPQVWIDQEVVTLAGISPEELARFKQPEPFASRQGAVPQPAWDAGKPHMGYEPRTYRKLLALSDEQFIAASNYSAPPAHPAP